MEAVATYAEVASDKPRVATRAQTLTARLATSPQEESRLANHEVLTFAMNGKGIADARRAMELYQQGKRDEAVAALDRASYTVKTANADLNAPELHESFSIFGNIRTLFAASANSLGGEDPDVKRVIRRNIANFGTNTQGGE